jgi:hypothetical protein
VPANRQVEGSVGGFQLEYALVLERQPGSKACVARSRQLQMLVDDVHSEDAGSRKEFGQTRCHLARAAARIEYSRLGRERIAANQRNFLRPNGARLRIEVAHHRLIGHLFRLRVEIGHGTLPVDRCSGVRRGQAQLQAVTAQLGLHVSSNAEIGPRLCGAEQYESSLAVLGKVTDRIARIELARLKQLAGAGETSPLVANGRQGDTGMLRRVPNVLGCTHDHKALAIRRHERHIERFPRQISNRRTRFR